MKRFFRVLSGALPAAGLFIASAGLLLTASGCDRKVSRDARDLDPRFEEYWYQNEAELTRYKLRQARFGEYREGDAVLIYVTEDFLADKQVKREDYSRHYENSVSVLKLNFAKKFVTGIYPYSIMTSIFAPVDYGLYPHALKTTTSVQEWCGMVFMQLNSRRNKYEISSYSYFQDEGDENYRVDNTWTEDEIWTRIRIAPDTLPEGDVRILPGTEYTRLSHRELVPVQATAEKRKDTRNGVAVVVYTLTYPRDRRTLSITFTEEFPYTIEYFEESYPSGFGEDADILTTTAVKTHRIMSTYWQKNSASDTRLRTELGLPETR
jgi:hypothetical protein